jgi:MraZ protein
VVQQVSFTSLDGAKMFRGSAPTKIDDKGRLKVPTEFRRILEERYGPEVFITSVTGESANLYPLPVWEEIESRLAKVPSSDRAKQRFLERVNYFGQQLKLDGQGRVVVPQILRERAEMVGDVVVSGRLEHLEIWNRERFDQRLGEEPFTEEDFKALADLGV